MSRRSDFENLKYGRKKGLTTGRIKEIIISLFVIAIIAFIYLLNKKDIIWIDKVPSEYLGTFKETSKEISLGIDEPDFIIMKPNEITFSNYFEDEGYRAHTYRVIKANIIKEYFGRESSVIFYDQPSERHFSSKRLQISYASIGLLVAEEVYGESSDEIELNHLGLFSKQ